MKASKIKYGPGLNYAALVRVTACGSAEQYLTVEERRELHCWRVKTRCSILNSGFPPPPGTSPLSPVPWSRTSGSTQAPASNYLAATWIISLLSQPIDFHFVSPPLTSSLISGILLLFGFLSSRARSFAHVIDRLPIGCRSPRH